MILTFDLGPKLIATVECLETMACTKNRVNGAYGSVAAAVRDQLCDNCESLTDVGLPMSDHGIHRTLRDGVGADVAQPSSGEVPEVWRLS